MVALVADRRRIETGSDPEAEALAGTLAAEYLDLRLRLAQVLLRIERCGAFHRTACSSIVQYAVRLGVPSAEARLLVDLGRALAAEVPQSSETNEDGVPEAPPATVETLIRTGQLPVENAALYGKLLAKPECVRPGEDWLERAETLRTPELRRQVQQRIEECAQGEVPLVSVTVHIGERARDDFRRARVLCSREAAVHLTEGQTFTRIVRFFLDARDEERRAPRARRVAPTFGSTDERYVPAEVRREVLKRSGDRCEVPGCALDTFLEFAHIEPHAEDGSREADNLLRLCHVHHTQFDADCLLFGGWREGHPVFRNVHGDELTASLANGARPRERADDLATAIAARRERSAQVSERPPPAWGRTG
jgi:hypothetical protein